MAKWADYCISNVRYNTKKTHIEQVKVYEDNGNKLVNPSAWTRSKVLQNLNAGKTFVTVTIENNSWQKGAMVKKVTIRGTDYIKTVKDSTEKDNLGKLPTF